MGAFVFYRSYADGDVVLSNLHRLWPEGFGLSELRAVVGELFGLILSTPLTFLFFHEGALLAPMLLFALALSHLLGLHIYLWWRGVCGFAPLSFPQYDVSFLSLFPFSLCGLVGPAIFRLVLVPSFACFLLTRLR